MKNLMSSLLLVTLGLVLGGGALAAPVGKVTICHFPPGNPDNAQVISVGAPAVVAHVTQHNDAVCSDDDSDCCFGGADDASLCTNFETDVSNCGGCGMVCTLPNATSACRAGMCFLQTCNPGFGDCDTDPSNGCETALTTPSHCGSCERVCPAGEPCSGGICVPVAGG